jgi:hypothetical protein
MLRTVSGGVVLLVLAGLAFLWGGTPVPPGPARAQEPAKPEAAAKPKAEVARGALQLRQLADKLAEPITLENGFEPNTLLGDAFAFLEEKFEVPILIDTAAFRAAGVEELEKSPIKLRRMKGVRLGTVLQRLLDQADATYLLRPDGIEATTWAKVRAEVWGQNQTAGGGSPFAGGPVNVNTFGPAFLPGDQANKEVNKAILELMLKAQEEAAAAPAAVRVRPMLPLVHLAFEEKPLDEALAELTAATGVSIVLDRKRVGDQARAPVSGQFLNTPLDTAARLLANAAELSVVLLDNVLVVTTPENAKALGREQGKANENGLDEAGKGGGAPPLM